MPNRSSGLLQLGFARTRHGRTYMRDRLQHFPLRTTVPLYLDPANGDIAYVYMQNPTGALFAGDHLVTTITADPNTSVHLTTQSATKVHRMTVGEACQELRIDLAAGAYVEYLPDQIIPQAGARLRQTTYVDVAEHATFIGTETLAPGRIARGEWLEYERISLRTHARRSGTELCVDALEFAPTQYSSAKPGALGARGYLATMLIIAPEYDDEELTQLLDAELATHESVLGAAGRLPNGAGSFVRILGHRAPVVQAVLDQLLSCARQKTFGYPLPERRK